VKPPERRYRGSGGAATDHDPLDRPITQDFVFHATVAHYAGLAGVSVEHLRTSLRFTLRAGEPVLARHIKDCAEDLARAGYRVEPALPAPRGLDAATLESDLASLGTRGAALRGRKRAPRRRRDRSRTRPEQAPRFFSQGS
jgi:hypothetical protein